MAPTKKQSIAAKEGFTVLSDADLRAGVENRVRQLESELASHQMLMAEAAADPTDDVSEEQHGKVIEGLQARLEVTRERLEALKANTAADEAKTGGAAAPPQP